MGRQLGFQHPIAAARLPYRGQQHGLGRELCVEDALGCGRQLLDRSVLARFQKSLARSSAGALPRRRPSAPRDFQQSFALPKQRLPAQEFATLSIGTSPNFHMLAWLVILFCPRSKKDWSEHAKLLEPRPCLCVLCCAGGNC